MHTSIDAPTRAPAHPCIGALCTDAAQRPRFRPSFRPPSRVCMHALIMRTYLPVVCKSTPLGRLTRREVQQNLEENTESLLCELLHVRPPHHHA